jgi:hypothetical protein
MTELSDNSFFHDVKQILHQARQSAVRAVNSAMVQAYWEIGRKIVEEEQGGSAQAAYGTGLLKELSVSLTDEFGNGFSLANLKNFRQFYLTYPDHSKGYALRSLLSQLKDPYVLEFLNLSEDPAFHEKDLESALINELQKFLLELGGGFSFVARQMRISTETSHFYLDLVFYHYVLKCFVVIDLKTEKLTHQDIGQMDMYVRMFDDLKRGEDDNPSIGIILCADKDETMVQYSVLKESEQLFASKYRLHLPTEAELIAELEREQARLEKKERACGEEGTTNGHE